ncbi:MAG: cytochrome c [Vicinamibacterales bacterium]
MRKVVVLAACVMALTARVGLAQDAAQGAKVYDAQKCAMCHAVAGKGNKKLPLDGVGKKLTAAQIKEWIVDPVSAAKKANSTVKPLMKAYPALPAADLDGLVAYMGSLK